MPSSVNISDSFLLRQFLSFILIFKKFAICYKIKAMFEPASKSKNLTAKLLAAFLAITLSGAYSLFCCQAMEAKPQTEFCPLSRPNHCKSSKNKASEAASHKVTGLTSFECCGLKLNFFVAKLEKNDFSQPAPAALNNFFNFLQSVKFENDQISTNSFYRAPVVDHREQRLKNCVFRI